MLDDYVLKVNYGGESLRVKLKAEKFSTLASLKGLISAAWPFLGEDEWKIIRPDGGVLGQRNLKNSVVSLSSEDVKDPSGHVPEIKLKVVPSGESVVPAPTVRDESDGDGLQALDGHPLALAYWQTCDGCKMFPIIGKWYICFTCGQVDLCYACRKGHPGSHKLIDYSPSHDGLWDNHGLVESLHQQALKLRVLAGPTAQPKFEFDDIQKNAQSSLPLTVARTFDEDEIPDSTPDRACYRDRGKAIHFSLFCHSCTTIVAVARRFKTDSRAAINLCDTCYLLHKDRILALAYQCSRIWEPGRMAVGRDPRPFLAVHHAATCAECERSPIIGARYTCIICSEFDLCSRCYHSGDQTSHKESHAFALVAKAVPLWSLKIREPSGTPIGEMSCKMCGNHPQGGARYRLKFDPPDSRNALYCQSCYQKMLQKEALQLRAPLGSGSHNPLPWAQSARTRSRTLRLALKTSLASRLNSHPPVIQMIRRLARQVGRFSVDDDDSDDALLEWAVEPHKELKSKHRMYDGPER
ncbi:hypothetical protein FOZ63_030458 [Perkinsus olseni]|uniref:ZZ-type domain-containing protein n=2 Tax=Perkinsus olseni TaxID=32597 RepID=A0A7J6QE48_PEROL|nr:hypothetical protein FOZ63_030458 [Perkinsus olseni]